MKKYIETGKIVGTHGIKGEMRVQPWADDAKSICAYKTLYLDENGEKVLSIKSARVHGNVALLVVDGVDNIESAEKLRGKTIFVSRADINVKKGSYLIVDLIGCKVYDADSGKLYGEISEVFSTGANDVWTVKYDDKEYLLPAIKDIVAEVDVQSEIIKIRPIKGIFDDEN